MLYHGDEIEKDNLKAAHNFKMLCFIMQYFKLAIQKSNVEAINDYTNIARQGEGVTKDPIETAKHFF